MCVRVLTFHDLSRSFQGSKRASARAGSAESAQIDKRNNRGCEIARERDGGRDSRSDIGCRVEPAGGRGERERETSSSRERVMASSLEGKKDPFHGTPIVFGI